MESLSATVALPTVNTSDYVTSEHTSLNSSNANGSELNVFAMETKFQSPFEILFYRYMFIVIYVIIFIMCVFGEYSCILFFIQQPFALMTSRITILMPP